jgi:hypothetical protein
MNRFVVTVDFKPKSGRWRHPASSSMRMRKCHASANRGAGASPYSYPRGRTTASFFMKSMKAARPSVLHLPSPHLATFNTTSGDLVVNKNVAKLDFLIFEGSNNRR